MAEITIRNSGWKRLVTTYFSGMADETDLCFTGRHPLEDVLGVMQEEIDAPSEEFENQFAYNGTEYPARRMCEINHAKEGAEVISSYKRDFYEGCPVVTRNAFGKGEAYYLAAESDLAFLRAFYGDVFRRVGLKNALDTELPYGVTVTERTGTYPAPADGDAETGKNKGIVFVMNFKNGPVCVDGIGKWTDAESGAVYEGKLELGAFQCAVLERQAN